MGKGAQAKIAKEEKIKRQLERERLEKAKKKRDRKIALAAVLAFVLVLCIIAGGSVGYEAAKDSGKVLRGKTAMSLGEYEVTGTMMTYFTYEEWQSFQDSEGDVSYYGIDKNEPLADQQQSEGRSWLDYFTDLAEDTVSDYLYLCCAADAEGYSLSSEELDEIDKTVADISDFSDYGRGVNAEDVRQALKIKKLALSFEEYKENSFEYTSEQINAYYAENRKQYDLASFVSLNIPYGDSYTIASQELAEQAAGVICDIGFSDAGSLAEAAEQVLTPYGYSEDYDYTEDISDISAGSCSSISDEMAEWIYAESTNAGDRSMFISDSSVQIVYLITKPYPDESYTVNVRHILFNFENYKTNAEAREAAEKVFAELEASDKSEDSFEKLADEYNEDSSSLYEDIEQGDMVTGFDDWIFDESRVSGDCGLVETQYGWHIIYFVNRNLPAYLSDAESDMRAEDYDGWYDDFIGSLTNDIETNYGVINKIEL